MDILFTANALSDNGPRETRWKNSKASECDTTIVTEPRHVGHQQLLPELTTMNFNFPEDILQDSEPYSRNPADVLSS